MSCKGSLLSESAKQRRKTRRRKSGFEALPHERAASAQSRRRLRRIRQAVGRSLRTIRTAMQPTTAEAFTQTECSFYLIDPILIPQNFYYGRYFIAAPDSISLIPLSDLAIEQNPSLQNHTHRNYNDHPISVDEELFARYLDNPSPIIIEPDQNFIPNQTD